MKKILCLVLALVMLFAFAACGAKQEAPAAQEAPADETKTEDKNRIIVNVAKQRNGPNGEVELVWLGDYTKFENPETSHI